MKRTSITVTCVLAELLLFTAVPSFASLTTWTWTANGSNGSGSLDPNNLISNVIFSSNGNTDTFTMNLNTYSATSINQGDSDTFSITVNDNNNHILLASGTGTNIKGSTSLAGNVTLNALTNLSTIFNVSNSGKTLTWFSSDPSITALGINGNSSIILTGDANFTKYVPITIPIYGTVYVKDNETGETSGGTNGPTVTPIPGAVWLLGSGLMGLVGIKRRKV